MILSEEAALSKLFCLPLDRGMLLQERNLLPRRANSFLLEQIPFQTGLSVPESKHEVIKVVSLGKQDW